MDRAEVQKILEEMAGKTWRLVQWGPYPLQNCHLLIAQNDGPRGMRWGMWIPIADSVLEDEWDARTLLRLKLEDMFGSSARGESE